jgi:hypothetical protein
MIISSMIISSMIIDDSHSDSSAGVLCVLMKERGLR